MAGDRVLEVDEPIPSGLEHSRFVATPLTSDNAVLDYAAYMASPDVIDVHSAHRWPVQGFTLSDDLELVAQHEADHASRRAFTFALLTPSRTEGLGSLYVNSLQEYLTRVQADPRSLEALPPRAAMVTFWLRQDQQDTGLADELVQATNEWLLRDWPVDTHLFRVSPDELSSRMALERLELTQTHLALPGEERAYLWYRPS